MAQRKRIALIFKYDEKWIGGTYYILNIVHALNTLSDEKKPEITICALKVDEFNYIVQETNYPYLEFFELTLQKKAISFPKKMFNVLFRLLYNSKFFYDTDIDKYLPDTFDLVFPNAEGYFYEKISNDKKVAWVPDFQEAHLPEIFSAAMILRRKQDQIKIALISDKIILSSQDAQNDFNSLYPFARCKQYVVPFAVTLPHYKQADINEIKNKFGIGSDYFYAPNQFWAHKNHILVAQAVLNLKNKKKNILILFSGSEHDARTTAHIDELKKFITDNELQDNFIFMGFIDRIEQLTLMDNAIAIIQPSLFEGWSTVIEDSKAMNQFVIASDLNVHKEQISQNILFFGRSDANDLAQCIEKVMDDKPIRLNNNYAESIKTFAQNFMTVIN